MEKRIVLELRGEERSQCTSLDLSECKTGGEWEVWQQQDGDDTDDKMTRDHNDDELLNCC